MPRFSPVRWFAVTLALAAASSPVGARTFQLPVPGFGTSVAAVGSNVAVGAPGDAENGGLVVLFDKMTGDPVQTFADPDSMSGPGHAFGSAVAAFRTDAGTYAVLVGAPDDDAKGPGAGAAYLFTVGNANPIVSFYSPTPVPHEAFGWAVAAVGNAILIGAPGQGTAASGKAYLFTADGATSTTLVSPSPSVGDGFGTVVGALGGAPLVGVPFDGMGTGAAYLFPPSGPVTLRPSHLAPPALLGASLGALGSRAAVGAPLDNTGAPAAGAVYVFDPARPDSPRRVQLDSPVSGTLFGASVAALGSELLIGAPYDDTVQPSSVQRAGAAYVVDPDTGHVERVLRQRRPFPSADTRFGFAVAAMGTHELIAAPGAASVYLCVCGDGLGPDGQPDYACGEQCDDGMNNGAPGDRCSADCQVQCNNDHDCASLVIDCLKGSTCDGGRCRLAATDAGTPCSLASPSPCPVSGRCDGAGACIPIAASSGTPTLRASVAPSCTVDADCDDHNMCTVDSCSTCTHRCVHTAVDCTGGDPCATDCDPATGQCRHDPACDNCLLCDYFAAGRSCCGSDALLLGQCAAARQKPDGTACDDGNACTNDDLCEGGKCIGEQSVCPLVRCTSDAECDDGDPCNGLETCRDGGCVQGAPPTCVDGVPCALTSGLDVSTCPDPLPGVLGRHLSRVRVFLQEAADAARAGKLKAANKRIRQASASLPTGKAIRRARKKGLIVSDCAGALGAAHRRIKSLRQDLSRCAG